MGLCLGKTRSDGPSPWPDLPEDLAGLILRRLPSYADRLSFGAVCHDWRLAAKQQRPPAMPLSSLGPGSYQSIADDGKIYRFVAPSCRPRASFGSWLLYEHSGSGRLFLRDLLLSGATPSIEIPRHYHECADDCDIAAHAHNPGAMALTFMGGTVTTHKIVVCSVHLLAAIIYTGGTSTTFNLAFFRPGNSSTLSWSLLRASDYRDIAFHRGRIFALTSTEELFVHELNQPCRAEHGIDKRPATAAAAVDASEYFRVKLRLVVSSDDTKLLMVRWSVPGGDGVHRTMLRLQVFEADLEKNEWSEVKDLGDQVLFISDTCSRAMRSSSFMEHTDSRFRGGNRVFLLGIDWASQWITAIPCSCCDCERFAKCIPRFCVYDIMSGKVSVVSPSEGRFMGNAKSEWFFPY